MKDKLYLIVILGICMIALGFAIDNVKLTNELNECNDKVRDYAMELVKIYNENDHFWEICN